MYAVIKTGGKQYKVASGDVILVEKLDGEAGASITLAEVLMIGDGANITVGAPTVKAPASRPRSSARRRPTRSSSSRRTAAITTAARTATGRS